MKILIAHNRYQMKGGEDFVVENESRLLASKGHEVHLLEANNDHIHGIVPQIQAAAQCLYSTASKQRMADAIRSFGPEIVHIHNLFPTLSSSVLDACNEAGVPYVRTLHNYRLICPKGVLYRDGAPCELCIKRRFAWPGVQHGCYRGSKPGTLIVALASLAERRRGTRAAGRQNYITLSDFVTREYGKSGLPDATYHVKPNFLLRDPGVSPEDGDYFVFVSRMVQEKGVEVLLEAWKNRCSHLRLKIAGTGPLSELCAEASAQNPHIEYLGHLSREETDALIKGATAMIFPPVWYEPFGLTLIEAYAAGRPVIAAKIGSLTDTVVDGVTGLHFVAGDSESLSDQVLRFAGDAEMRAGMRVAARADFEEKYTAGRNYERLIEIYQDVIAAAGSTGEGYPGG